MADKTESLELPDPYPLERLFGRVISPFERFLRRTTAGGIILMATTVIALGVAAAFGAEPLHHFREERVALVLGGFSLQMTRHHAVNDGLMALFFLLVGLELKREILVGELASIKDAALPVLCAAGGMAVPAAIYVAFNHGTPGIDGWGIPMATDIAFAIGILVLLAWRVPRNLIVFLTALAIADDLGAVLVIAIFYTAELDMGHLALAGATLGLLVLFNRSGIRRPLAYWIVGLVLWYAVLGSGIHATIAGILLAACIPARAACPPARFEARIGELLARLRAQRADPSAADDPLRNPELATMAEAIEQSAASVQSPLHRMEHGLTPWVTFLVIPVFALANAGIDLRSVEWGSALSDRITLGVIVGLVAGKFLGIASFGFVAVRLGLARLPEGVRWPHFLGAAWLAGIGFTMSIFIAELAFADPVHVEAAKLGVLVASALSAVIGLATLVAVSRERRD